ncbi:Zinc finger, RING/FYVE/PHD-type [Phytophthora cactorum]|nr:Zinc finger, RING/FYVE/PHD-type [Phytophthora cactorum]
MGDARIVLTTLISEKLLSPGPKKLYVSYYRKRVYADLLPDGSIRFKDQIYTSPVPCALHMKRTLNPSLKTDAGWSSMYSAASGESLKDIKDRLNIRKRGTNARSVQKEKKAPTPSPTAKERMAVQAAAVAAQAKQEAAPLLQLRGFTDGTGCVWIIRVQKCAACRTEATTDVAECSACHSKTHFKCATPALQTAPPDPRVPPADTTSPRGENRREKGDSGKSQGVIESEDVTVEVEEEASSEDKAPGEASTEEDKDKDAEKDKEDAEVITTEAEEKSDDSTADSASVPLDSSNESKDAAASNNEAASEAPADEATSAAEEPKDTGLTSVDARKEKDIKQESIATVSTDVAAVQAKDSEKDSEAEKEDATSERAEDDAQLVVAKMRMPPVYAEEKFLVLIDSLIEEVSSKSERANLIANSTGATLVHLEKTQLVQLVEYGKREILAATRPESEEDEEQDGKAEADHDGGTNSEVDALIKIFDLRHQILSSQSQFERTTSALAKRTEKHLRNAETELMELEESQAAEARVISKVVDLIDQYSGDLTSCEQKIHFNEALLASVNHRRNFIRSTNINDRFVPSYRYSTKLMTTSSDQLLLTVLLEKLRDITESVNEWTKMEHHFEKMTSSLNMSLTLIGTKRKRTSALPPTPALFAKVKIPPSRRLIERQIANYEVNMNAIRQNRARMRNTLSGILKIAREEHLSDEIVNMTDMLYQKCRDLKAEQEEEELRIKEEAEAEEKAKKAREEEEERAARDHQSTDDGDASAEEPEAKKQRLSNSVPSNRPSAATPLKATSSSDMKGISSLLGSEDSDAKESNYSSAESKSHADNEEDSEADLELASRAIADISSVLPDISGGSDARADLLTSPPMSGKIATDASPGRFSIRGGKGPSGKRDQQSGGQDQQSFLDQALEGMLGMGSSQQDIYAQQAAQMGMDIHDVVRHQDSSHFAQGGFAGLPQQPAPTAPRTSFYSDEGQMHSQDVFGSQGLPGQQQRQLSDHHMFANELQQQTDQSRSQDFLMGRSYRGHGMDQSDNNDVNMDDWGQ